MLPTIEDILNMDGIVIRKIPKTSTSNWSYREGHKLAENETIVINHLGRKCVQVKKTNKLAGYIVKYDFSQDSTVIFNKRTDGLGDTLQVAYQDLIDKNKA